MAYQNVGTPRFYINDLLWGFSNGITSGYGNLMDDFTDGNPSNQGTMDIDIEYKALGSWKRPNYDRPNYYALLGHNLKSIDAGARIFYRKSDGSWNGGHLITPIVNSADGTDYSPGQSPFSFPDYDGFSMWEMTNSSDDDDYSSVSIHIGSYTGGTVKIGTFMTGRYYDMPHSPDLKLTMTREYGGVKTIETKGGASLSNSFYTKPPKWANNMEAWQLGDQDFSVGGRRIWDLNFSYLSDSSVFPDNPTEIADGGGWEVDTITPDFMSEVLRKVRGSMLPFIFQPDKDNNNEFAICRFDMNSLKVTQTSPSLYQISLKIRESW